MISKSNAKWIWPRAKGQINQYVQFRHVFELDSQKEDSKLLISCEGNFAAYINGEFAATGQFTDYPDAPTFSQINVGRYLRKGTNVLGVVGYHFDIDHFSHISSDASLIYCLCSGDEIITSGEGGEYRLDGGYHNGDLELITSQMGFVFEYDARKDDGWSEPDYVCGSDWDQVTAKDFVNRPTPVARPLPMLELKSPTPMKIVAQGKFKRDESASDKTFAELVQGDFLSATQATGMFEDVQPDCPLIDTPVEIKGGILKEGGAYLIVDMGGEECGFISLDVEGPSGAVIDIAVGEHLEDMRVRASVGGRNFASRYVCGQDRQHFVHYNNRYAGRFMELHISPTTGPVRINYAGIIPSEYPISMSGEFKSPDSIMNKIYEVSRRTPHLCVHEHYEDCPWREQALYANDSRNQALSGYYAFGEYDLPRVSFDLLGRSIREDNYLTLTAPSSAVEFTIPSFTMAWFVAMDDLLLFGSDRQFAESHLQQIQTMLDSFIASCKDGLLPCPKGKGYWHFYDWADDLDGTGKDGWQVIESIRFDAPLNLFFVMALQSAARMCKVLGSDKLSEKYIQQANAVRKTIDDAFWVESRQAYQSYLGEQGIENHFCELVQALAILTSTTDSQRTNNLRQKLITGNNGLVPTTLSQSLYKYEALCGDVGMCGSWVFADIQQSWSQMLYSGATSFWETIKGHVDFGNAGSLCNGWSAIPIYFYQAYLLGVKPIDSGFKKFSVIPVTNIIDRAKGTVMTPSGAITVEWENTGPKTQVKILHPRQTEPVVNFHAARIEWNIESY